MTTAYEYVIQAGGVQLESDYPYTGVVGKCRFDPSKIAAKVANFTTISLDEDQIAANLVQHGPLAGMLGLCKGASSSITGPLSLR